MLLLGVFYFLLIRPQQRRAKAQQALIRSVEEGDEIVMTSGIIGTIVEIDDDDDTLTVEIAPGTQVRILRAGVGGCSRPTTRTSTMRTTTRMRTATRAASTTRPTSSRAPSSSCE